jgi:stage II sporulation protein R
MKKICITFLLLFIIILTVGCSGFNLNLGTKENTEYLRIHVRANDNSSTAQRLKYKVKDGVVAYLTPLLKNCKSKAEARRVVLGEKNNLTTIANRILQENGANYTANAEVKSEIFPTRVYSGISLPYGKYEALIISLGNAQGENWWCVVYPPLCFTGESENQPMEYHSFLYDLFRK